MKTVALIPLRGGSKSILRKNIKLLAGKPLCYWVCYAASQAKGIDTVYVSTDDAEIRDTVLSLGLGIKIIDRPAEFAQDTSSTESVMLHFMEEVPDFDLLITLQATSPLTTSEDIDNAINHFSKNNLDSLLTAVRTKRFFWTEGGKAINYDYLNRPRRQDFDGFMMENGAFYITKKNILKDKKNRLGGKIGVFEMREETAIEIDEPLDWYILEKLILKNKSDETNLE